MPLYEVIENQTKVCGQTPYLGLKGPTSKGEGKGGERMEKGGTRMVKMEKRGRTGEGGEGGLSPTT